MRFREVAVVGVGLIGGSFALALKEKGLCGRVVGAERSRENLRLARRRGIVDAIAPDAARAAENADLILVATPVSHFEGIFREIRPVLKPAAIVTDAGSTKRDVVAAARRALGARVSQFVPAHPIAGAEKSGAAAADAGLFKRRRVILTPLAGNSRASIGAVEAAWRACGARVGFMTPREHDAVLAAVSHLPHMLAYALVSDIAGRRNAAQLFGLAAGGFRDFTRIASSHPEMWRDIALANRDFLASEIRGFESALGKMRSLLAKRNSRALEGLFARARAARERWLRGGYG